MQGSWADSPEDTELRSSVVPSISARARSDGVPIRGVADSMACPSKPSEVDARVRIRGEALCARWLWGENFTCERCGGSGSPALPGSLTLKSSGWRERRLPSSGGFGTDNGSIVRGGSRSLPPKKIRAAMAAAYDE